MSHNFRVIRRFEDLIAWQKARKLYADVHRLTNSHRFRRELDLARQMRRASNSIMSNIAEGFERNRLGEFHQFLSASKASCAELRSDLYGALDVGLIDQQEFETIFQQADEVARVIGGLRASIARERTKSTSTQDSGLRTQDS